MNWMVPNFIHLFILKILGTVLGPEHTMKNTLKTLEIRDTVLGKISVFSSFAASNKFSLLPSPRQKKKNHSGYIGRHKQVYQQLCFAFLRPELMEPFILFIHSSERYFVSTNYVSGPSLDAG